MPVTYRSHVAPRFHRWVLDGMQRLHDHPAMAAGRELAQIALDYTVADATNAMGRQLRVARLMADLKAHGVTAEHLMCRVAELFAFFQAEPTRCLGDVAENMALGRAVVHLVPWSGPGAGQGKRLTLDVAAHVREHLGAWALAFVRRLGTDQAKEGELLKRAATFD